MKPSTLYMMIGTALVVIGGWLVLSLMSFVLMVVGMFFVPLGVHFLEVATYIDQRLAEDYGLLKKKVSK